MKKFAFISMDMPSESQIQMAEKKGIKLIPRGDMDPFTLNPKALLNAEFDGVVVTEPVTALRCIAVGLIVGVFENVLCAPEQGKPSLEPEYLHIITQTEDHGIIHEGPDGVWNAVPLTKPVIDVSV